MIHFKKIFLALTLVLVFIVSVNISSASSTRQPLTLNGTLNVVWGDVGPGSNQPPTINYFLTDDRGVTIELLLDEATVQAAGGILALNRQRVAIVGTEILRAAGESRKIQSQTIQRTGPQSPTDLSGPQPWISIACKFSDYSDEPKSLGYFSSMYSSSYPGLDHYWREQSYDKINLTGSAAAGWFALPHPMSYYTISEYGTLNLYLAVQDCTHVADPYVNFANYVGINMMFNEAVNSYAYAGASSLNLDGVQKTWGVTWLMPWAYTNIVGTEHEMGHAFGLPNSSGNYGSMIDNQWDVMSDMWSNCANATDPVFGCLGQHTISDYKTYLAWLPYWYERHTDVGQTTVEISRLAQPPPATLLLFNIWIGDSETYYYSVEARQHAGYDNKLPGEGVIIHEVDRTRLVPAHVIDIDNNGNTGDEGAIWRPGEVFEDSNHSIYVCINSQTANGYSITEAKGIVPSCASHPGRTPTNTPTITRTLTPTFTPDGNWIYCAHENATCTLPGTRLARFGANGAYLFKLLNGSFMCKASTFGGDPIPGVVKHCDYDSNPNDPLPTNTPTRTLTPTITPTATQTSTPTMTPTIVITCLGKPAKPGLLAPADKAILVKTQVKLKWSRSDCADTYTVVVTDKATGKIVETAVGLTTLQYKTQHLQSKHTYQWRVKALNKYGSIRSKEYEFTNN